MIHLWKIHLDKVENIIILSNLVIFDYKYFNVEIQTKYEYSTKIYVKALYKSILYNLKMIYNYIHSK